MNQEQVIVKNFELFKAQVSKLSSKGGTILNYVDNNAERIMLAPASTKRDYTCCHPGGLVEHSLRVLQNAAKLRQVYNLTDSIATQSVILCSLFHDIGKIGTQSKEYYVDNTSDWHRDKLGVYYNIADRFQHVPVSQLSLFTLSQNKVEIDIDEWYAMSVVGNKATREDLPTQGEPWISVILSQAIKSACVQGKGKEKAVSVQ
jgi:hypothetical protein